MTNPSRHQPSSSGTRGGRLVGRAGAGGLTTLYESALDQTRRTPTGITWTNRWLRTITGFVLIGVGLIAAGSPIVVLGAPPTAAGWHDRLLHRYSPLR